VIVSQQASRRRRRVGWWLALATGALVGCASAATFDPEAGLPLIRNFPPEVYRGHSQIFATAGTADGVMYFGTYGAVVSYDGERWRQFELPGTWTRALTVGADGYLYVGGGNVLGRLEPSPEQGELRFVSLAERLPDAQRKFASVWSAVAVGEWVFFAIDGAVLGWRAGAFRVWPFPGQRPAVRAAGSTGFCHVGDQVWQWREEDWRPWARDARLGAARRITILPADRGWRIACDNGVMLAVADDGTMAGWPTPAAEFLQRVGVRNGLRLADGSYVFSTAGEGLVQLAADGTPVRRLTAASGLANAATYGLGLDRDQNLWVETANGLSVFDPLAPWSVFDSRNGRPDAIGGEPIRVGRDLVLSVSDVAPHRLVPAPDGLGSARLAPLNKQSAGRYSMGVIMHGGLLHGTERGVVRLDGEPRLIHPTSGQVEEILPLQSLPEVLVVGMLRGVELVRVTPRFGAERIARVPDFELEATNLVEIGERTVWVATTSSAVLRLQLDARGAIARQTLFAATSGLPAGIGWVKLHAAGPDLLACVRSGVFRFDPTTEKFRPDPRFARHFPAGINTLPVDSDDHGRFWFQMRKGAGSFELGCLDTRGGKEPTWEPLAPPLNAALGFGGARSIRYLPEAGGEILWVSGTRSAVRVELDRAAVTRSPPGVLIAGIEQGARRWWPRSEPLRLPFRREPLRLVFGSASAATEPVSYEARLLGYDDDWTPVLAPEVAYTNLFGGPFTLEVRARDALGRVGEVARTTFSIAPPWHRSAEAYVLYGLAAGGAMFGFLRWRLGRAERERRRLAALVAARTAELATARDQAEAANRAKSAFLAAMSHELRTPLNGVIGYAQVLQADRRLAPDQQERVRIVQSSGEHLLRMINDVLDLAKIEAGKFTVRPAPFSLRDLVRDIAAAHTPAAGAKHLAFQVELAPELPAWVEGDAQKVRQILDNLIGNAVKFTAAGSVTLRVRAVAGSESAAVVEFSVADTGAGISAADQARLFHAFEQANDARPEAPGTGLGLAIVRALVERLCGRLTLASELGAGSTFTVTLPLPAAAAAAPADPAGRRMVGYDGERRRVLVVDDHDINRRLLVDLLTPLGFECSDFSSPAAALARLAEGSEPWPDLAIIDVRMAGLDGLELTRALRALPRGPQLKVLLTSASVLSFDVADGRRAGADDFIAKPFQSADLLDQLGRLLALQWRRADLPLSSPATGPMAETGALPEAARAALREHLANGDLEALRTELERLRSRHAAPALEALDAAAARYDLPLLRALLG
jgi:signal transduction histidine kinase/CheY-like chemotaxis protein